MSAEPPELVPVEHVEIVKGDRPRRYSAPRWHCLHVAIRQWMAAGSRCNAPATHAVRASEGGVLPLCLRHANRASARGWAIIG